MNGVPENATNDIESENRNTSNLAANKNATTVHGTQKVRVQYKPNFSHTPLLSLNFL